MQTTLKASFFWHQGGRNQPTRWSAKGVQTKLFTLSYAVCLHPFCASSYGLISATLVLKGRGFYYFLHKLCHEPKYLVPHKNLRRWALLLCTAVSSVSIALPLRHNAWIDFCTLGVQGKRISIPSAQDMPRNKEFCLSKKLERGGLGGTQTMSIGWNSDHKLCLMVKRDIRSFPHIPRKLSVRTTTVALIPSSLQLKFEVL